MVAVAVQMDPLEHIKSYKDTTFAFMLEAQKRGCALWCYEPENLFFDDGILRASGRSVRVRDIKGDHYEVVDEGVRDLSSFDVVLVRQDPPFDMAYVANTYLLDLVREDALIINAPSGIRNYSEKFAAIQFYDLMPPTFIGRNLEKIRTFAAAHDEVVLKPAFLGMGASVVRTSVHDAAFAADVDALLRAVGKEPILVQKFLPKIVEGDKRIMLLGGVAVGALRRVPSQGEFRANVVLGGRPVLGELDARDQVICARVGPVLREAGITFAGIDVIDGLLNEINVTSPTLVRELLAAGGPDIPVLFWDQVETMLTKRS